MELWNKWCHLAGLLPQCRFGSACAVCKKSLTLYFVCAPISSSCCLDCLPTQFSKTHFTDTTGAIKGPWRNISIEECLYFALIVHLLWQTSKRGISALLNAIYCGMRCFDETSWTRLSPYLLHHWDEAARKLWGMKLRRKKNIIKWIKTEVVFDTVDW